MVGAVLKIHYMKHILLPSIIACLGFASVPAAHAQIITSVSGSAPSTNVAVSFTTANYTHNASNTIGYAWKGITEDRRDYGQTFTTTSSFLLDRITLQLQYIGSSAASANYALSLYQFATASSLTAASTVGTWTGTLPDSSSLPPNTTYAYNNGTVGPFLTFDLPNTTLSASTTYGFVLSFQTLASSQSLNFWVKGGGAYNGGQSIEATTQGATTFTTTNSDVIFYALAIPEGSTFAMTLGGVGFLVMVRRFRKRSSIQVQ